MKYTLLELTSKIMSALSSDTINSITDTAESLQVVEIIETVYNDIITRADLPEHYSLVNLTASGDNTKPVLMYIPTNVSAIDWIKYNVETTTETDAAFTPMKSKSLPDFLATMHALSESDDNVVSFTHTVNGNLIQILCRDDAAPSCFTSFDDNTVLFDRYDADVDTTLQSSKSLAYGLTIPVFTRSDTFTPDLDANQFSLLINESKALAFAELLQTQHAKAETNARRGWVKQQKNRDNVAPAPYYTKLPNYGRK